mgnify:FL=1
MRIAVWGVFFLLASLNASAQMIDGLPASQISIDKDQVDALLAAGAHGDAEAAWQ